METEGRTDLAHRAAYRPDIDGLRALAILPVVIYHAFPAMVGSAIPSRLRPAELGAQLALDARLKQVSVEAGAEYVSPLSLECNMSDCLVALKSEVEGIMAFDYAHLTPHGSEFAARSLLVQTIESH